MPLPFIAGAIVAKIVIGATVTTGVVGAYKGGKGIKDTREAKDIHNSAEAILDDAKYMMTRQKRKTSTDIQKYGKKKLEVSSHSLKEFVDAFTKIKNVRLSESPGLTELNKIRFDQQELRAMSSTALKASEVVGSGAAGVGAGVLLGWGAYGTVMTLGTASTGTAIGALSGVAATNATLAWLGGGSLAAGGGGMALGGMVLGGIVAGPALLLAGGYIGAKGKEKLNNAYSNLSEAKRLSEEINNGVQELKNISLGITQNNALLDRLDKHFSIIVKKLVWIGKYKTDWIDFTKQEKDILAMSVKYAQAVKLILDTPMLDELGVLTAESMNLLKNDELLQLSENKI